MTKSEDPLWGKWVRFARCPQLVESRRGQPRQQAFLHAKPLGVILVFRGERLESRFVALSSISFFVHETGDAAINYVGHGRTIPNRLRSVLALRSLRHTPPPMPCVEHSMVSGARNVCNGW